MEKTQQAAEENVEFGKGIYEPKLSDEGAEPSYQQS